MNEMQRETTAGWKVFNLWWNIVLFWVTSWVCVLSTSCAQIYNCVKITYRSKYTIHMYDSKRQWEHREIVSFNLWRMCRPKPFTQIQRGPEELLVLLVPMVMIKGGSSVCQCESGVTLVCWLNKRTEESVHTGQRPPRPDSSLKQQTHIKASETCVQVTER